MIARTTLADPPPIPGIRQTPPLPAHLDRHQPPAPEGPRSRGSPGAGAGARAPAPASRTTF
jgi:hypothetical protein